MQYEPPRVQVLSAPHCPEQQSLPVSHELPAVLQAVLSGAQLPSVHVPPQHSPSDEHSPLSDTQISSVHLPSASHWKLQQSGPAEQLSPVPAHVPTTDAQVSLLGSHTPEQHSVLCTHVSPTAVQVGKPGSVPGSVLGSPPLAGASPPAAELPEVPSPPSAALLPPLPELPPLTPAPCPRSAPPSPAAW